MDGLADLGHVQEVVNAIMSWNSYGVWLEGFTYN